MTSCFSSFLGSILLMILGKEEINYKRYLKSRLWVVLLPEMYCRLI